VEGAADVTAWTIAIHTACAASLARHLNRDSTIRLLQSKMRQLEISVDLVRRINVIYLYSEKKSKKEKNTYVQTVSC